MFKTKPSKYFNVILLLLVIALAYSHRMNLSAIGIQLFALASNSPIAEGMLGKYHEENQQEAKHMSYYHYNKALTLLIAQYPSYSKDKQAYAAQIIGSYYECGRGTARDVSLAKHWYEQGKAGGLDMSSQALERLQRKQ